MANKIVFCADGTWQHPNKDARALEGSTNVCKLQSLIANTPNQILLYQDGVGVEFPEVLGGAFGVGIFGKIKQGYARLAQVYEAGDELYFFGFSRGAYISRSLAGMVSLVGLPTVKPPRDTTHIAEQAFGAYIAGYVASNLAGVTKEIRDRLAAFNLEIPKMKMQGMWDTVGSLGFTGALAGLKDPAVYGFLNTDLHDNTEAAYHALAIDEHRGEFKPTLWPKKTNDSQILQQVWFTGVHSEVGGGAQEVGLSDITLSWMLKKAEERGLQLTPAADAYRSIDAKHALDALKDSWSPLWAFPITRSIPAASKLANSAKLRIESDPTYHPKNLSFVDGSLDPSFNIEDVVAEPDASVGTLVPSNSQSFDTHIDIKAGTRYHFVATGTWVDDKPPAITASGIENPGGIRSGLVNKLKRKPDAPWMALLGRVDDGPWFVIGEDSVHGDLPAGRLYCCANDVPGFYGNNHGSVRLDVEEVSEDEEQAQSAGEESRTTSAGNS